METPAQYREFAAECYRLASEAETEADRKTLLEIAQAWEEVGKDNRRYSEGFFLNPTFGMK
jgi:hypothetical protein